MTKYRVTLPTFNGGDPQFESDMILAGVTSRPAEGYMEVEYTCESRDDLAELVDTYWPTYNGDPPTSSEIEAVEVV